MKRFVYLLAAVLMSASSAAAIVHDAVLIPDAQTTGGKELVLNGAGTRKATFLKLKVYTAGLYLRQKSGDEAAVIGMPGPKLLLMHFQRDVAAEDVVKAWRDAFTANNLDAASYAEQLAELTRGMPDVKAGDELLVSFEDDAASLKGPALFQNQVQGVGFSRAVLRIWLGPSPADSDLKDALLGR